MWRSNFFGLFCSLCALPMLVAGGTVQQCLQKNCGTFYGTCNLIPQCRTDLIDCMSNCTSTSCEVECFTSASTKVSKLVAPALIALDLCGGSQGCFPASLTTAELGTPAAAGNTSCLDLNIDLGNSVTYHCDAEETDKAVMCVSNVSMPPPYYGNRCCKGDWLYHSGGTVVKHQFSLAEAGAWDAKCTADPKCNALSGAARYEQELTQLGRLSQCA